MDKRQVDVAIIGSGTAGVVAHSQALRNGAEKVVMIEDGPYGTMCARVGCMPSKALIAAAHAAHDIRHASMFGVHAPDGPQVDGVAVLERVRSERDRLSGHEVKRVGKMPDEQKIRGTARFTSPTTLAVEDKATGAEVEVEAGAIVIATGSKQWVPRVLLGAGDRLIDNVGLFNLGDLPASMAVVGTGVIGLELGQAMHRLGVRTSFFSLLPLLASATDPVIQEKMHEVLGAELDLHLPVEITSVSRESDDVTLAWKDAEGDVHSDHFDYVLVATGRRPRLAELDLEKAGIALDAHGVPVHDPDTMQCGESAIFIAGDATGDRLLQHEAAGEGRIAGNNAARFPEIKAVPHRTGLGIVFIDPQLGMCGKSFAQLTAEGVDFGIGEISLGGQGRLCVSGRAKGHLRIYGERGTRALLGAEIFGPDAEHLAHLLAWAMEAGVSVDQALALPFYHPVVEEALRTALNRLKKDL